MSSSSPKSTSACQACSQQNRYSRYEAVEVLSTLRNAWNQRFQACGALCSDRSGAQSACYHSLSLSSVLSLDAVDDANPTNHLSFASSAVAPLVVFHHYPFRDLEAHQGAFRFHSDVSRFQIGPATKAIERTDVVERSGVFSVMELD